MHPGWMCFFAGWASGFLTAVCLCGAIVLGPDIVYNGSFWFFVVISIILFMIGGRKAERLDDVVVIPAYTLIPQQDCTGWQPIETAPKDGTNILLWWRMCKYPSVGRWTYDDQYAERKWAHKAVEEGWMSEGDGCIPVNQSDCTHWQSLPSPPLPRAERGVV